MRLSGFLDGFRDGRRVARLHGGDAAEHHEHRVADRPQRRLPMRSEDRLEQYRIADERKHRPGVRERIETIRHHAFEAARVPRLNQRTGGREQEVRKTDGQHQQLENRDGRLFAAGRLPRHLRIDPRGRDADQQQQSVQLHLRLRLEIADHRVGIEIARQQLHLEKKQARGPHRRRAAEPRQNDLGDDRLHLEQQKSADQNRKSVKNHEASKFDFTAETRRARRIAETTGNSPRCLRVLRVSALSAISRSMAKSYL
jgi:hypothetical protein